MNHGQTALRAIFLLVGAAGAGPSYAQVFCSEFFADPVSEGWNLSQQVCEPVLWIEQGSYHQRLNLDACPPGPGGAADVYRRSLVPFTGNAAFFAEFRLETDGDRSEITGGAPALLVLANDSSVNYHITISRDLIQFFGDFYVPTLIEVDAGQPHTYRLELYADRYAFYIDDRLVDEGPPQGPLLDHDPRISWRGRSWYLACHNAWDYIRYGFLPAAASGDYDSNGVVGQFDYYFVHDCLTKDGPGIVGGPGNDSGPGCRFTDFDADADADLLDFAEFQNLFCTADPRRSEGEPGCPIRASWRPSGE